MADTGLSIGVLSGQIELDDKFTATITLSTQALDELEKRFGGTHDAALHVAEGMFTAEAAIEAVKEVAHLTAEALESMTIEGAKVAEVEHAFNRLQAAAGGLGDELLGDLKAGTHSTITDFELMKDVNQNLAAGVNLTSEQYQTLATGAFALAKARGLEVKDAFEQINDALLTGRIRGVQYLTGKIDIAAAEDAYAAKLNTTADRLSAVEKQEAIRVTILDKVAEATARVGDQTDGLDEKVQQVTVSWHNFVEDLGKTVATSPVILQAFDDIQKVLTDAFGGSREEAIKNITRAIEDFASGVVEVTKAGVAFVQFLYDWRDVLEPIAVGLASIEAVLVGMAAAEKVKGLTTAFIELQPEILAAAAAAAAIYAAFEIGKWQPISDFFEKLGLEVFYGMSSAEADAAVAAHHLAEEQQAAANAAQHHAEAQSNLKMSTAEWKSILETVDPILQKYGEELIAAGHSAADVAKETGLSAEQVRAVQYAMQEASKAAADAAKNQAILVDGVRLSRQEFKQYLDAWKDLNSMGITYEATLSTIRPEILESVKYYAEAGASVKDLTAAFPGLTKAQAEAAVESVKAANEISKVWLDVFQKTMNMHHDNIDDYVKLETQRFNQHIEQLRQEGKLTEERLNAEKALYDTTIDAEIQKRAEQITTSRAYYQAQYDEAKNKLDLMLKDIGDFTDADIRLARQDAAEKGRLLEHWAADANDKLTATENKTKDLSATTQQFGQTGVQVFTSLGQALDAYNDGLDATKIKVKMLDGEIISLAEAQQRQSSGGSYTYDLTTQQGLNQYKAMNTAATISVSDQTLIDLAKKGMTLEQMIQAGYINPYGRFGTSGSMPSFERGGIGEFGSGTMAMLHGNEAIIPLGSSHHYNGDTVIEFSGPINGTGEQVARQTADIIMKQLKTVRQFPSA